MIHFINSAYGYTLRTRANVRETDCTIAIAVDYTTGGEQLTEQACNTFDKLYIKLPWKPGVNELYDTIDASVRILLRKGFSSIHFNIAGNGIYTLTKFGITQEDANRMVHFILEGYIQRGITILSISSGGQTGIDEAALHFAQDNFIKGICRHPSNWLFRDINGNDIADKQQFLNRFL